MTKRSLLRQILFFVFSLLVSGSMPFLPAQAPGQAKPSAPPKVTAMGGITEYRLDNGLRVLLLPDATKPTITVNITYLVGSRHESYGETGMAHLLEHMVFKRTEKYNGDNGADTPASILNKLGSKFNGSTNWDRTNYFITFPATDDNLRQVLDLESERMGKSLLRPLDLWNEAENRGERTVVVNELDMGENNPVRVTLFRTLGETFHWQNYGKSTIGCRADLLNVDIRNLQAFYQMYYQPDNAVLFIGGKIDEAKTLGLIQQVFGAIPKPTRALRKTYTVDDTPDGERIVTVRRVGDVQLVNAAYRVCAGSDPDAATLQVLTLIMTDVPCGRLYKALVETRKASVVYSYSPATTEPGFMVFGAQAPKENNLDDARDNLLKELEQAAAKPFTAEEVERAKRSILTAFELAANQTDQLGGSLGSFNISEFISLGDWRLFYLIRERIGKVTPEMVQKAAAQYFKPANRAVGLFIPTATADRPEIPPQKDLAAMLKDFKGPESVAQGEVFDTTPAAVEAKVQRFVTPSGLKVALAPKKTRGESVSLNLVLRLGDERSLANRATAGALTAEMLMRGTTKHTRQQIQDEFDRLKAQVQLFGNSDQVNVAVTTLRPSLPEVLRLVAEVLREPSFPAEEFSVLIRESINGLEQQRSEPEAIGQNILDRHLNPYPKGHPRYVATLDEDLSELKGAKLEQLKAFHQGFYGFSAGELAIVGDVDAPAVQKLTNELFGTWKAAAPFQRIPRKTPETPAIDQTVETPDKANAVFLAGLNLPVQDTDPDYPALFMGNFLLGAQRTGRLRMRIREKEGLSYVALSQLQAAPLDKACNWMSYVQYGPQNLARVETAFKEELAKARDEGFTAEQLDASRQSWLQGQEVSRSQDAALAAQLARNLFLGRTMAYQADLEAKIKALTNDQIVAALRKYLDPAKISYVKAGDFKKAAATK